MELGEQRRICVSSTFQNVRALADFCRSTCAVHFDEASIIEIELAVVEAANNIVEHAYKMKAGKPIEFSIICEINCMKFIMIDTGQSFPALPEPDEEDDDENIHPSDGVIDIDDLPEGGRGLAIMRKAMNSVSYFTEGKMNILMMVRNFAEPMKETYDYYPFLQNFTAGSELTKKEVQTAVNLYRTFVPSETPEMPGLKIFAKTEPALTVGGDHLAFKAEKDCLWFMICDVMGKGMSAAFFSMLSHMTFKSVLSVIPDITPGELISRANRIMASDFDRFGMFMTALAGKIEISQNMIHYASAGHCPPILYSKENGADLLDTQDFMMGVDENAEYRTYSRTFEKGMKLLTYTDGITDIVGPNGEIAGVEPLLYACNTEFPSKDVVKSCQKIFEEILIVSGKQALDDLTMIGIERC